MEDNLAAIRVGVIGCGDIAEQRHIPTIHAFSGADLVALCDSDTAKVERLAKAYHVPHVWSDYKQMLQNAELDAVVIATPPWITPYIAMDSLRAGKHVLCEKPMALDVATAMRVKETELETGYRVQVGFTYRHGPLLETLRSWIRENRLGSPLVYRLGIFDEVWDPVFNPEHYERIYRTMQRGSPSIHDGAHVADFLNFLSASSVRHIESFGLKTREEFPSSNYDMTVIEFENGDMAKVEIGWFLPKFPKGEFEVIGPKGIAIFDRFEQYVQLRTEAKIETVTLEEDWAMSCFREQFLKFMDGIRLGQPFIPGSDEGISSLQLTKAIETSIHFNNHKRKE